MKSLTIVIPTYNEFETLPNFLPDWVKVCNEKKWDLIIVNDGSTDGTKIFLEEFPHYDNLQIIHHKLNKGYGAALKTGIRASISRFVCTMDSDGQHSLSSVSELLDVIIEENADLVIGMRENLNQRFSFRSLGKMLIRFISRITVPNTIRDLNSGMKIYYTDLAKRYIQYCPNTMAFSDIITLTFLSEKCLVIEHPIIIKPRQGGKSTVNLQSAIDTAVEIINIVMLFNPLRLFMPLGVITFIAGLAWGLPIILRGDGLSIGALFALNVSFFCLILGLLAEQISQIRKAIINS